MGQQGWRSFDRMWRDLADIGRDAKSGGYNRFAWTPEDACLTEWFSGEASSRRLDLTIDRNGNSWAWWGDPDAHPGSGIVFGSHLDSVPSGGAFDGPLGIVSAFAAIDLLRDANWSPDRPVGIVRFGDEEGARFGVACAGSRLLTGVLDPNRARSLPDLDGTTWGEAARSAGLRVDQLGRDLPTQARIGTFVELHIEQGRGLIDLGQPVGLGSRIWPHGRYRIEFSGRADHAGTTRLTDRDDPMLDLARTISEARMAAERHAGLATVGKVVIQPGAVNAIPGSVAAWLDTRGADDGRVRRIVKDIAAAVPAATVVEESWTDGTDFDPGLTDRLARLLGSADVRLPVLSTGAGHDAGILAAAGVPVAMVFVRNRTGISHSPAEFAEPEDCYRGVAALARVMRQLAGPGPEVVP